MKKKWFGLVVLATSVLAAGRASAQSFPLSVEVRGGITARSGQFPDDRTPGEIASDQEEGTSSGVVPARGGLGFGATALLRVFPLVGVYGGWEWHHFNAAVPVSGTAVFGDANYIDQGFSAGAQITAPTGIWGSVQPWLRAGAIFHTLEVGELKLKSKRTTGYEIGGGVDFPVARMLSVGPRVIYRSHKATLVEGNSGTASAVEVSLGLKLRP